MKNYEVDLLPRKPLFGNPERTAVTLLGMRHPRRRQFHKDMLAGSAVAASAQQPIASRSASRSGRPSARILRCATSTGYGTRYCV